MRNAVLLHILVVILAFPTAFAQPPEQIHVTSLTITKTGHNTDAIITMEATGLPAPFASPLTGYGEALWNNLESCLACPTGSIFHMGFDSGNSGNFVNGFYPNGSSGNTQVKFYMTGTAPDIVMDPRLSRKKNPLIFSGQSILKGRIEVHSLSGLVAVDDNVDLSGSVKTEIYNYLIRSYPLQSDQRAYSYKSITFSYSQ